MHRLRIAGIVLPTFGLITGIWGVASHRSAADSPSAIEALQLWAALGIGSVSLAVILLALDQVR